MAVERKISLLKTLFTSSEHYFSNLFKDIANTPEDLIYYRLGKRCSLFVKHPHYVKHMLLDNHANYVKGDEFKIMEPLSGRGLASVADYQQWKKQRHTLAPAFHTKMLERYSSIIVDLTVKMMEGWSDTVSAGKPLHMTYAMEKLTFSIATRAVLNVSLSDEEMEKYYQAINTAFRYLEQQFMPLDRVLGLLPSQKKREYHNAINILNDYFYRLVNINKDRHDKDDFMGLMMSAHHEGTGAYPGAKQMRDEIGTILVTGYETVSTLLTWVWVALSKYPEIGHKLKEELKSVLGGRLPTYEDLPNLHYTRCIVQETLRLYPPAWLLLRKALEEDEINGHKIPKNADILIFIYFLHRHPEYWQNPEGFNPDRFMEDKHPELKNIYCPFGIGPRSCIGNAFALMEAQLIIATIFQQYEFELLPGSSGAAVPGLALKPHGNDLWMRVNFRK